MHHDDIDRLLARRAAPPSAQCGLAERIIHAAITDLPQRAKVRGQSLWAEIASMFALPHPAVALATFLAIGLAVGLQAGDGLSSLIQPDWSSFLDIDSGDWS